MRSLQLSDLRETVGQRPGRTRDFVDQLNQIQRDRTRDDETRRTGYRSLNVGSVDLAIGVLSIVLALIAWQRDRAKSRQEFIDGAVFVALGVLERYVDARQGAGR